MVERDVLAAAGGQTGEKPVRPFDAVISGLTSYVFTSTVVVLGVLFGVQFAAASGRAGEPPLRAFAREDGNWYRAIVDRGYTYNPEARSPVAFFPLYPLLATGVARATGWPAEAALLLVSHASLAGAFVLAAVYLRQTVPTRPDVRHNVLLALGLMPATLFFRMAYSESLFLLLVVLFLLAVTRGWGLLVIAVIVGLATATRPVGIGLVAPFLLHCWHRSPDWQRLARNLLFLGPVSVSGLAGYVCYQQVKFGEPLAFVRCQAHWGRTAPPAEKVVSLLTYEPIWETYLPDSPNHWRDYDPALPRDTPLIFNWHAINPIYFTGTAVLLIVGYGRRWLTSCELVLSAAVLLIPYVTRGYEMTLDSHARFAAVAFPVYVVLGHILARLPGYLAGGILAVSSFLLGVYSALYATNHLVF